MKQTSLSILLRSASAYAKQQGLSPSDCEFVARPMDAATGMMRFGGAVKNTETGCLQAKGSDKFGGAKVSVDKTYQHIDWTNNNGDYMPKDGKPWRWAVVLWGT